MDFEIARLIALLIPLAMTGGAALIGWRMWLAHKARLQSGEDPAWLHQLTGEMEALQGDVQTLRDAVLELHERVDFAERLLTRGETQTARNQPGATPA
jgi:hypothetical protein